jgi:hypothetical protein
VGRSEGRFSAKGWDLDGGGGEVAEEREGLTSKNLTTESQRHGKTRNQNRLQIQISIQT